ncbi:iron permease [Vibrio sp. HA2012]|uniref:FTR1 family iron permease n=1 Tax=Vibrio sp. HA2012 TaxID=1971595 RepID=UPI000C2C8162|nr:FTR1 family protein [Vibrio sp. HA2012]PJC86765.1 iron permease [Vibrio sp. HA2012]
MRYVQGLFLTVLLSLSAFPVFAAIVDYQAAVEDINARLDKTFELYQAGKIPEAKSAVQMAYFDVYEDIEGPIRINYSQKYSYQLEAKFGEIRKLIADKKPLDEVQQEIEWLKSEVATIPDILASGHQLVAETQDLSQESILPFWRTQVQNIETTLNQALTEYRESAPQTDSTADKQQKSYQLVQQAQFTFYKNSELEIAIRLNRSTSKAADYNDRFKSMLTIAKTAYNQQKLIQFSYELSTLVQDLKDDLPGLPATRDEQKPQQQDEEMQIADKNWDQVVNDVVAAITAALGQYQSGQADIAVMSVQDSYFDIFEASGMENALGARDASFKAELEGYFTRIVGMMKADSGMDELQAMLDEMETALQQGADTLSQGGDGWWAMLIASLTIILREGLEALLIVAAITAYLIKNEAQDKLYVVKNSVITGLIASLITAVIFQWLFTNSGANRELLEGLTMMVAVVVLFFMSYWLLSKVEAVQWKRYLEKKLSASMTTGSLFGLWFASFLAVYREGAETVLFYYALASDASSAAMAGLFSGLAIGVVILLIIFFIMRYSVVKLPLKPFFIFTGGFMYLMAFVFAGKGVLELIEGKMFEPTLMSGVPEISLLGIYPYMETLIPQGILLLAAVFALIVIKSRGARLEAQMASGH